MPYERCLLILKGYLGDAVMVEPLVRAIANAVPSVCAVTSSAAAEVLRHQDGNVEFLTGTPMKSPGQVLSSAKHLRRRQYDLAIVVNRSFRSALLAKMAAIPIRAGHSTEGRGFMLTHPIRYPDERNETECYLDLARAIDIPVGESVPSLNLTPGEREEAGHLAQGATVAVQPGARYPTKQLSKEQLSPLLDHLRKQGHKVAFVGGQEEAPMASGLLQPGDVDLIGKCSIRQSMAALSAMKLTIGGDTGVLHLAAGVGCPTLTVFGPTPCLKWGHLYAPHEVIQAEEGDISRVSPQQLIKAADRILCG